MAPLLSLVTGTYNRPRQCIRLIQSVLEHTTVPFELVISEVGDLELQIDQLEHIRFLKESPRLGHSKGYNRAFRECRGEFILWLNDDAEVTAGYDVEAVAFMQAHPRIGLGALHYSENGGPFHVNSAWPDVIYANFGIFPRWLGEQVGFFDEEIEMYGADNSFAFRVLMADYGIADIPNARILHHSEKDQVRVENQANRLRDNRTLTKKYMPYRKQWTAAYQRHRIPTTTEPWAHGVRTHAVSL